MNKIKSKCERIKSKRTSIKSKTKNKGCSLNLDNQSLPDPSSIPSTLHTPVTHNQKFGMRQTTLFDFLLFKSTKKEDGFSSIFLIA
ncbi:hypothetical protein [Fictibacillus halophilus]|uniref:hypothetical protein n=1 Tax=Fictibacillus halophilus TaxID=1610490 RepID=UPI0033976FE5